MMQVMTALRSKAARGPQVVQARLRTWRATLRALAACSATCYLNISF